MSDRHIAEIVRRLTSGIDGRLRGLVRRGILGAVTPGVGAAASVKSTFGDVDDDVEVFQQHGFYSVPMPGAECVLLRAGGAREHSIAVAAGDRSLVPPGVLGGEVAVYHPSGSTIVMRTDGSIEVFPAPGQVVKLGGLEAALPVARQTDPVNVPSIDALITTLQGFVAGAPDGGAALAAAIEGALTGAGGGDGTITAGGTGATST